MVPRLVTFLLLSVGFLFKFSSGSLLTEQAGTLEHIHPHLGARWVAEREPHILQTRTWQTLACSRRESATEKANRPTVKHSRTLAKQDLPVNFTIWDKWKNCPSMKEIRDQSNCGSCWAFGAVESMSDRYCIATGKKVTFSSVDLVSCCSDCGDGCEGGYPTKAWDYWVNTGIVTESCLPYPFPPCAHHYPEPGYKMCDEELAKTPKCLTTCKHIWPRYEQIKGNSSYNVPPDEESMMQEIITNGPIEVSFAVYEDFVSYRSGVYFHAWGELKGYHAVRLVGWGMDNDVPYWMVANSWNKGWGEKGFVRFLRGFNECEIESDPVAGLAVG